MTDCLAMAGLAEAAVAWGLLIAFSGLVLAGIAIIVAVVRKSWRWVVVAVIPLALVTVMFQPWLNFAALTAEEAKDRDQVDWHNAYQTMGQWWVVLVVAAVAGGMFVWLRRRGREGLVTER